MDTVCGLGLPELIVIALIAFVVVGPQRTRELGLTVGRWLRRVMRSQWWREFNQITAAMRDLPNTLVRMAELEDDIRQVRGDINRATRSPAMESDRQEVDLTANTNPSDDPWGIGSGAPGQSSSAEPPLPSEGTSDE